MDKQRAELQLRQLAHTFRREGGLHGPESRQLHRGRIPKTITIGGSIRITRMRLQAAFSSALDPDLPLELPGRAESLRELILKALKETGDPSHA